MISEKEIIEFQNEWGNGIVKMGKDELSVYAFSKHFYAKNALFKPTMAKKTPFRLKNEEFESYFVGGIFDEDSGFALKPWSDVHFENAKIDVDENTAYAVGHYFFTDSNGETTKVEYSFVYQKNLEGLIIKLHHSSLP
jgi:hypothetical protein